MVPVRFDLLDQHVAVLTEKATALGLSLEDWFKKLVEQAAAHTRQFRKARSNSGSSSQGVRGRTDRDRTTATAAKPAIEGTIRIRSEPGGADSGRG